MHDDRERRDNGKEHYRFTSFHELMTLRIAEILLISSTYDAYIMQEDGPLAERIIHEYRGLNLSRPPRLTWISNGSEALDSIRQGIFDLVIVMPNVGDINSYDLCARIKELKPDLPIYYFAYSAGRLLEDRSQMDRGVIDRVLLWSGNTDLLLAIVKNEEDRMNVELDTALANIRVIIFVEDSPLYLSSLLPVLYREVVLQTQAVMDDSLNEKDRLLRMRTRPKILVAENYEQAWALYQKYRRYLFCVIADVRFEREGRVDPEAGIDLLRNIAREQKDLPLLVLSSEGENRAKAEAIPALFSDKNSPWLHSDLDNFFKHSLGFGDFLFRLENGVIVARAGNLRSMANVLRTLPSESIRYHGLRNDFSRWLMARFEMEIAQQLRSVKLDDFEGLEEARQYLITIIRNKLKQRQRGLVTDFVHDEFDPDSDFIRIGKGSLGGKARGLAFVSNLLHEEALFTGQFDSVSISLPKTLVLTTEGFDRFSEMNHIHEKLAGMEDDGRIEHAFMQASFPDELRRDLLLFLQHTHFPLAVRSSAILEDAHYRASAGVYNSYMLPNNSPDITVRLEQLITAIKLIYSSMFQETPRILARTSLYRQEEDKMAVIIQQLIGRRHDHYFYPAISGVAHSYNFYPVGRMLPTEGVAHIALGLGKLVVDGGAALRFSPKYPQLLPQFSSVDDILHNAQRFFYALDLHASGRALRDMLARIEIDEAVSHYPVQKLASTYNPEDARIRDYFNGDGFPLITFAAILKYQEFPLGEILLKILEIGEKGMGCPVEIEFAINLVEGEKPQFYLLQMRPMAVAHSRTSVRIDAGERRLAWCFSDKAMGQSQKRPVHSVVYVKPARFDPARTREIARELEKMNATLKARGKRYLLIGPGRWGTADPWLGVPVQWSGITEVHTIIETTSDKLHADPSQGSHFFHNITSLGINYFGIPPKSNCHIALEWLDRLPAEMETEFLRYVELDPPALLKIDGKTSCGILLPPRQEDDG